MAKNDIEIAKINTKLDNLLEEIREIKQKMSGMYSTFILKEEAELKHKALEEKIASLEEKLNERLKRLEVIIYSMIGLILTGFLGALIALVYKK